MVLCSVGHSLHAVSTYEQCKGRVAYFFVNMAILATIGVDELVPATGVDKYQLHHLLPLWNVDRLRACRVANQGFFLEVFYNCKGWYVFGDTQLFLIGLNLIRKADRMYW